MCLNIWEATTSKPFFTARDVTEPKEFIFIDLISLGDVGSEKSIISIYPSTPLVVNSLWVAESYPTTSHELDLADEGVKLAICFIDKFPFAFGAIRSSSRKNIFIVESPSNAQFCKECIRKVAYSVCCSWIVSCFIGIDICTEFVVGVMVKVERNEPKSLLSAVLKGFFIN